MSNPESYQGFEQGPIRPPSEAGSLLLRVMRNCSWNHCTFCPVYKDRTFSRRPKAHLLQDIDAVHTAVAAIREVRQSRGSLTFAQIQPNLSKHDLDPAALAAAWHWLRHGAQTVFLQDANVLMIKPEDLLAILNHLNQRFPHIQRITCYARSSTAARLPLETLRDLRQAGLSRVHIGLESGSDQVLRATRKGTTQAQQITAGVKLKQAGMELSEYYMPGLGGAALWEENARQTALALNRINPDYIRIRSLALPPGAPLTAAAHDGTFAVPSDELVLRELQLFLESLDGITSTVANDHIVNLLPEVEGRLPQDKDRMLDIINQYWNLPAQQRLHYRLGRRLGWFSRLQDLEDAVRARRVAQICQENAITPDTIDSFTVELMRRYI
jgi:Radical SAM superfamily